MKSLPLKHILLTLAALGCGALAQPALAAVTKAPAAKPVADTRLTEPIAIFHRLPPARAEALQALIERFNAQSQDARFVLASGDWRSAVVAPHLLILDGEDEERFLAGASRFKPLHAMMKEAGVPLQTLRPPASINRNTVDPKGQLLALPVGLSTPVLFLNRDALRRAGLNPDRPSVATWFDLQTTLGQLADAGHECPYTVSEPARVMVQNLSAWHNEPVTTQQGKTQTLSFNGMFQVKHVAMMASWARARYLHVFDGKTEAEARFASGDCAVIAAPSASWADFRRHGKVEVGVTRLPYYDGSEFPGAPQNTLADGPALWASAGKKPAEYKAMARFVGFWLQPENQIAWQRQTGYLPLNRAGLLASGSELLGDDLENVRVAVGQLTNKPATTESASQPLAARSRVHRILDEELAGVWSDHKAAKEALDNAVARASAI
jgi:sn-glycerol 3-phosphate transport system substrate-binding protein